MSFGGFYGSESMKRAYQYVDKGWINFLGTDIHGKKYRDALVDVCKKSKFQKLLKKNTFLNNQL
jgi:tyrosine-protein phosphatase YwqE